MNHYKQPLVIAIVAVSGGGKTTISLELAKTLNNSKILHFDDYEFIGPDDICEWVEKGADYSEWDVSPLVNDVKSLKANPTKIYDYIILDYPFAYKNEQMKDLINYAVFIDTPLDIAMARRMLRDFEGASISDLRKDLQAYLVKGRNAYTHMLETIKPMCDVVIDGSLSVLEIEKQVRAAIRLSIG